MTALQSYPPVNVHSVVENIHEPVLVISGTGIIRFANRAFYSLFDTTPPEILEKSVFSIRDNLFSQDIIRENFYFLFSNSEKTLHFDMDLNCSGEKKSRIRIHGIILELDNNRDVSQILLQFKDLSAQISLEVELKRKTVEILERTTAVTKIWDQVLIVPMIGTTEPDRARKLIEQLLMEIRRENARYVIIDGSGVTEIDAKIASHIINAISAIHLLGSKVIITSVKPDLAMMMAEVGISLDDIISRTTLTEGIVYALHSLGYSISQDEQAGEKGFMQRLGSGYGFRSSIRTITPLFSRKA